MSKTLLIYEKAVPVSSQKHREWSVQTGKNYSFAKHLTAVPLTAVEFPHAAAEYAIVFTGNEENVMPSVIMGVRQNENLYVKEDNAWGAKYIPAFVRRYPFVFASNDEGKSFMLCIDEEYSGCNQEGRGERLFDSEGNKTQYIESVLEFVKQYQAHFQLTQNFCKKLRELQLLDPMNAQMTLTGGQRINLTGFLAVNRDKLKALAPEKLAELAKTDELELIYMHLQSMRNFTAMVERVQGLPSTAATAGAAPAPEPPAPAPAPEGGA
jgi:hypothetical protein